MLGQCLHLPVQGPSYSHCIPIVLLCCDINSLTYTALLTIPYNCNHYSHFGGEEIEAE